MENRLSGLRLVAKVLRQLPHEVLFRAKVFITRPLLRRLANQLVTPFTPFVLSDWYISNEVDGRDLRFLNSLSKRLTPENASAVAPGAVIYVQVDQLHIFEALLPNICSKVVLLTGKWGLPGLQDSEVVRRILAFGKVDSWWSQNQIFANLPINLFPYGLDLFSLPKLTRQLGSLHQEALTDRKLLYVPFARVHEHLSGDALAVRRNLEPYMHKPLSQAQYFREMSRYRFVVSPRGDRPDTYRHYEALALGAIPVTDLPAAFKDLFGEDAVFVSSLVEVAKSPETLLMCTERAVDPLILQVQTWRTRVMTGS
jgi:hypothetical protein